MKIDIYTPLKLPLCLAPCTSKELFAAYSVKLEVVLGHLSAIKSGGRGELFNLTLIPPNK
jgi:hypothetical protein